MRVLPNTKQARQCFFSDLLKEANGKGVIETCSAEPESEYEDTVRREIILSLPNELLTDSFFILSGFLENPIIKSSFIAN